MEIQNIDERLNITLPNILDLPASTELRQILLEALHAAGTRSVGLDASQTERISTAALQVIQAARSEFADSDKDLFVLSPSDAFSLAVNQIGLDSDSLSEPATKV